jgi:ammonia channel protein AmtB
MKIGFAGTCTALILLILKFTIGIRLSPEEELRGLDHIGK